MAAKANQPASAAAAPRHGRRLLVTLGVLVVAAAAAAAAWKAWRSERFSPAADPRAAAASPYRNVRPDVPYVGDEACARCHPVYADSFRDHPMGRSFATAASATLPPAGAGQRFEKGGWLYEVERRGPRMWHKETRRDDRGGVLAELREEVKFVVGSGTHGQTFLVERDGFLYESPVGWYAQKRLWDLSPGYTANHHFQRPVVVKCLFCHSGDALPVAHTVNGYRPPVVTHAAIGCERCHGPGELHVRERERGDGPPGLDDTIVNPRRLEPALREAVCQQCHLSAEERVLHRGRQPFDFRPGLPLYDFWSVFVRRRELANNYKFVSQVEQMAVSRCYRASDGQLGCISCHDAHAKPPEADKAAYYRERCLECHAGAGCSVPAAERRRRQPDDSCTACHMPANASTDISHTAMTDHRILRRPDQPVPAPPAPRGPWPDDSPLVHFYGDVGPVGNREVARDLGLALIELSLSRLPNHGRRLAGIALPLLDDALRAWPDDVDAWEAKAGALQLRGRLRESLEAFEAALAKAPQRERVLAGAALVAEALKQPDRAADYWRRALAVNPWSARARAHLAEVLGELGQWREALAECEAALRLNPTDFETRKLLVRCHLRLGEPARAAAEFDRLLGFEPPEPDRLRAWFRAESR